MNKEKAAQIFKDIHKGLYFNSTKDLIFTVSDKKNLLNLLNLCIMFGNSKEIIVNISDKKNYSEIKKKFNLTGLTINTEVKSFIYSYIIKIKPKKILSELEKFKINEEEKINYVGIFNTYKYF